MGPIVNHRRVWILLGLCLALLFSLSPGVVEAKKASNKCEGTKKQRKQKMEKREITDEHFAELLAHYKKTVVADQDQMKETIWRRIEREYKEHQATGEPFALDVLVVSGGGAKGAFGAGFLEGWGTVPPGPMARPEFDIVTGVSTGALIAPFAFIGTDEAYAKTVDLYANPGENWVKKRGALYLLPKHVSLLNNCHFQDMVRESVGDPIVQALAAGATEDRLLAIGTTNLDAGSGRVFNLGLEAQNALESGNYDRIHSILLASSAIPGGFPPVVMDEMLYADGGATSNLILLAFPQKDGPAARFLENNPGAPSPKVRIWVLVNQQLLPKPVVTQPRWVAVSGRALDTLTSTSQLFAMDLIKTMVEQANRDRGIEAELHYVAIPMDAPKKTTEEMFDKQYMLELENLGRLMGADPASWSDEIPSAYGLEDTWLDSD